MCSVTGEGGMCIGEEKGGDGCVGEEVGRVGVY